MDGKVVQTTLTGEEYERLKEATRRTGKNIKEAVREAILTWSEEKSGIHGDDPIFKLKAVSYGSERASERVDEMLYGEGR